MPIPNIMKRRTFSTNPMVDIVLVNSTAINGGLHGTTIAPKKNPKTKALSKGLVPRGASVLGRYLPTSISTINSMLIIINIPKAMGDTISITLVKATCRMVVKINPSSSMKTTIPAVMISPNIAMVFLFASFPDS